MTETYKKARYSAVIVYKILLGIGFLCLIGSGITDNEWFAFGAIIFLLAGLTTLAVSRRKEIKKG